SYSLFFFLFFLMIRRPPRSTLFPYRRSSDLPSLLIRHPAHRQGSPRPRSPRSEEHTSELQSLAYLVCRLLLEKKKKYHINLFSAIITLVKSASMRSYVNT